MTDDELARLDTETREAFEHWARQLAAAFAADPFYGMPAHCRPEAAHDYEPEAT